MKRFIRFLVPMLLVIALIGCAVWYLFVYDRDFTRDVLLKHARYFEQSGNHAVSEWFYNQAYAHADKDEDVAIELAEQYKSAGNYTKAEYTLSSAIAANLAKGFSLAESVQRSKNYISGALSAMSNLGKDSGPMNHAFDLRGNYAKEVR